MNPIGDLMIERFDSRGDIEVASVVAGGIRYQWARPLTTTEDATGNLYTLVDFSTYGAIPEAQSDGLSDLPELELCKFTLDAELTCYAAPHHKYFANIVGGAKDVLYALHEVDVDDRLSRFTDALQRYELP